MYQNKNKTTKNTKQTPHRTSLISFKRCLPFSNFRKFYAFNYRVIITLHFKDLSTETVLQPLVPTLRFSCADHNSQFTTFLFEPIQ